MTTAKLPRRILCRDRKEHGIHAPKAPLYPDPTTKLSPGMALLRVILPEVPDRDYPITPEMISIFRKGPFFKADSQA